jgi:hypothetical protein
MARQKHISQDPVQHVQRSQRLRGVSVETRGHCGPTRPVSGFLVASTSPVSSTPRPSNSSAAHPGVGPGARTARGHPGTSSLSPSGKVDTSRIGISLVAPRRASENKVR